MKNKVILLAMTCLAMITTAWGQVESFSDRDLEAEQYIFAIQKVWLTTPFGWKILTQTPVSGVSQRLSVVDIRTTDPTKR